MKSVPYWTAWSATCALSLALAAEALAADPPLPPGPDPGGVLVAIVADGFDYTHPDIASRLARDGEGEIIGFDFVDDDRTPFGGPGNGDGAAIARVIITEAPSARIALLRAAADTRSIGRSLSFLAKSPARVALVALADASPEARRLVDRAARSFGHILFVVAVAPEREPPANTDPSVAPLPENLLVAPAARDADGGGESVPVPSGSATLAAARVAAAAARVAEAEPSLSGAEIRRRVLAE